jgi:hypothetical protein
MMSMIFPAFRASARWIWQQIESFPPFQIEEIVLVQTFVGTDTARRLLRRPVVRAMKFRGF